MGDIRARLKPLFRRTSTISSAKSSESSTGSLLADKFNRSKSSLLLSKSKKASASEAVPERPNESTSHPHPHPHSQSHPPATPSAIESQQRRGNSQQTPATSLETPRSISLTKLPGLTLEEPTPELPIASTNPLEEVNRSEENRQHGVEAEGTTDLQVPRPQNAPRRQSLAHSSQNKFLKTLLESDKPQQNTPSTDYFGGPPTISTNMLHRKIWVKRPGASATLVLINEDDLVDDVRDMILKKYANSLGRNFDAPDVTLRIIPRDHSHRHSQGERTLGPEEPIARTLDAYFPGGQIVDEALVIDVPQRRTPRHSPRAPIPYYMAEDLRPGENGTDYFPQMPPAGQHSPHIPATLAVAGGAQQGPHHQAVHSIAILNTGQVPLLPSPGGRGTRHAHGAHRPKFARNHTSSPTAINGTSSQNHEILKAHSGIVPTAPQIPTPPPIPADTQPHRVSTPPPRTTSPRLKPTHRRSKNPPDHPKLPAGLLDGAVPPINVLIVEDNIINLKLLEAFLKRLKVRWKTAMNGREAVTKWRAGGFHLVLMDIQLPVMNGLDATKEIRRLERLNHIGVFSSSASSTSTFTLADSATENSERPEGEDSLMSTGLFKSPVIIVALTASSLQSDRHEALAAGCNDFLTKPVNFVWLERKVMEWGCMQALIDFDGWRKWKDFTKTQSNAAGTDASARKASGTGHKSSPTGLGGGSMTNSSGGTGGGKLALSSAPGRRDKRPSSGTLTTISASGSEGIEGDREPRGSAIVAGA